MIAFCNCTRHANFAGDHFHPAESHHMWDSLMLRKGMATLTAGKKLDGKATLSLLDMHALSSLLIPLIITVQPL